MISCSVDAELRDSCGLLCCNGLSLVFFLGFLGFHR